MSIHQTAEALEQKARILPAAALHRPRHERAFDLHPAVHMMVIASWFSFVGILVAAFMGPDLIVPAGIFLIGVASLFVTPALWARVKGDDGLRRQSWSEFMAEGIQTHTGHMIAKDALAQIMTLPVLLVGLAMVMAVIKMTL